MREQVQKQKQIFARKLCCVKLCTTVSDATRMKISRSISYYYYYYTILYYTILLHKEYMYVYTYMMYVYEYIYPRIWKELE